MRAYYQLTESGETCDDAVDMTIGLNTVTDHVGDQYFTFTTPGAGELIIKNCDILEVFDSGLFTLYNGCDMETPISENIYCEGWDQYDEWGYIRSKIEYTASGVETVTLKIDDIVYDQSDYNFNMIFTESEGGNCNLSIDLTDDIIVNGKFIHEINAEAGIKHYKYTAPTDGYFFFSGNETGNWVRDGSLTVRYSCEGDPIIVETEPYSTKYESKLMNAGESLYLEWDGWNQKLRKPRVFEATVHFYDAEGSSCEDVRDITEPMLEYGRYKYYLDNTDETKYYKVTAPEDGYISISSIAQIVSPYQNFETGYNAYLIVRDECNGDVIIHEEDPVNDLHYIKSVSAGETVYWEWDNRNGGELFYARISYHPTIDGAECDTPVSLSMGTNTADNWFGDKYYQYTASKAGQLEISTCESNGAHYVDLILLDGCSGQEIGATNTACSIDDQYGNNLWKSTSYDLREGETVLVKFSEQQFYLHNDYTFEANFTVRGNSCVMPLYISEPDIYEVDNTEGSQFFAFTPDRPGKIAITTIMPSVALGRDFWSDGNDTKIEVFDACGGNQLAYSDNPPGAYSSAYIDELSVDDGTTYIIEMSLGEINNGDGTYQFELFYWEDVLHDQDNPLTIEVGDHIAPVNYQDEVWYEYTFPENGVLWGTTEGNIWLNLPDESPVFITYDYDVGGELVIPDGETAVEIQYEDSDSWYEREIYYNGVKDETIKIKITDNDAGEYANGNDYFILTFTPDCVADNVEISETACESFEFDGTLLTSSGDYAATFTNQAGCDSLVNLSLTIHPEYEEQVEISSCEIYEFDGNLISASGDYTATFQSVNSCDSLVNLALTILESDEETISKSACHSYTFDDTELFESGDYSATFTNLAGCDSLVNLSLTIHPEFEEQVEISSCETYEFDGNILSTSGEYTATFQSVNSCDSLVNLALTILESDEETISKSSCHSYTFDDTELFESGDYSVTFTNLAGCDSLVNLSLTIHPEYEEQVEISSCETYEFDGEVLLASGQYEAAFQNKVGCDSLVTLSLTIHESDEVIEEISVCDSYEFNEEVLLASGQYEAAFQNKVGCDSLVTLNLTILESDEVIEEVSVCDSYKFDGETLLASGQYEAAYQNKVGCDSLVTLNLTILELDEVEVDESACEFYVFDAQDWFTSGTYNAIFTNQAGCDSLVTLNLTIHDEPSAQIDVNGVVLFAQEQIATSYQWIDCDTNEAIDGETKRQLTPPGTGTYAVEVSNDNCTVTSECLFFDWVVSVPENSLGQGISIYPTLTPQQFTIDLKQNRENVEVRIIALSGKLMVQKNFKSMNSREFKLEGPSGVYLVQVSSENQLFPTQRIIKTK